MNTEIKNKLAELFLEIEIEGYQHTAQYPYKMFGRILKRKQIKEELDKNPLIVEEWYKLLKYFKIHGLNIQKKKKSDTIENTIYAFLHYALLEPTNSMVPYNTIKLRKIEKSSYYENEKLKVIKPKSRNKYLNKKNNKKVLSLKDKINNNIETENIFKDKVNISNNTFIKNCKNPNCINGYIKTDNGVKYCECYLKEMIYTKFKNAGIPKNYFKYNFLETESLQVFLKSFGAEASSNEPKDINKFLINYNKNIERIFEEGWNLTISGPLGSGKTTVAAICGKIALMNNKSVLYAEGQNLRKIWTGQKLTPHLEILKNKLTEVDLLIIDDFGQEFISSKSEYQMSELDLLFRERITRNKPYIITTNALEEDIKLRYSERIYSLLQKNNLFFTIYSSKDLRKNDNLQKAEFLTNNC